MIMSMANLYYSTNMVFRKLTSKFLNNLSPIQKQTSSFLFHRLLSADLENIQTQKNTLTHQKLNLKKSDPTRFIEL